MNYDGCLDKSEIINFGKIKNRREKVRQKTNSLHFVFRVLGFSEVNGWFDR
jgi:hypothetical protein